MKSVVILCFFIAGAQLTAAQSNKTVLAIVAHPDDETALAEVLVKLLRVRPYMVRERCNRFRIRFSGPWCVQVYVITMIRLPSVLK
jgi:hypothetical protein